MSTLPRAEPQADATPATVSLNEATVLSGTLHVYVAFDWGDEVDLERARQLVPAEVHDLPRRRRTPSSISYRPPPLRFLLDPLVLPLPDLDPVPATAEATVFDFAAVSVALHVPFRLPVGTLKRLAGRLADPGALVQAARTAVTPLHARLAPALLKPQWKDDMSEEFFVFHLPPGDLLLPPLLLDGHAAVLAGLLRLEQGALSGEEITEAVRLHISYSPEDLFVADWAAAVLVDHDCDETLQAIEFANLQLLEFRHIDDRLDDTLTSAYRLVHGVEHSWLSWLRGHGQELRTMGELRVEANGVFERTGNVLKLVGDQYLARVYRLLATRFHLREWERSIERKLETAEGVYQVLSDQADSHRSEFMEIIVIVLIVLEVVLALFHI
jgi:hypothetical protein